MYQQMIREILAKAGRIGTSPRAVEALMRLEFGTLDGLDPARFRGEALCCADIVDYDPDACERLADSYCL